jgi:hypothetical protein
MILVLQKPLELMIGDCLDCGRLVFQKVSRSFQKISVYFLRSLGSVADHLHERQIDSSQAQIIDGQSSNSGNAHDVRFLAAFPNTSTALRILWEKRGLLGRK